MQNFSLLFYIIEWESIYGDDIIWYITFIIYIMVDKDNESGSDESSFEQPTIEEVLKMTQSCDVFYTDAEDNVYDLIFSSFKVRDVDSGEAFIDVKGQTKADFEKFYDQELEYYFPHRVLKAKSIGSNIGLVIGKEEIKDVQFIERHYFEDALLDSYSFKFPFFMPNSENNIEFIYNVPKLPDSIVECLKTGTTFVTYSDTFLYVNKELITHRRAKFYYVKDELYDQAVKK